MRWVRYAFAWLFAMVAAIYLWITLGVVRASAYPGHTSGESGIKAKAFVLAITVGMMLVYGMAWWKTVRKSASARGWGIAASLLTALLSIPFVETDPSFFAYGRVNPGWILIPFGITGLLVFALQRMPSEDSVREHRGPLPGDGTSSIVNRLVVVVGVAANYGVATLWTRWAEARGISVGIPDYYYLQFALVLLLVIAIHESGHALAGVLLDMKLISFVLGPLQWWIEGGKWKFKFNFSCIMSLLGATQVVPVKLERFRSRKILQVAAGPAASVLTGMIASILVLLAAGRSWESEWLILSNFATISVVIGIFNLVPFGIGGGYSDGAKLLQLMRGGLWADYQRVVAMVYAIRHTAIRPRDLDIATIERAAGTIAVGADEAQMHFAAYSYYLDLGSLEESANALVKAATCCSKARWEIPDSWYSVIVFGAAFLRGDAAGARAWWNKLEQSKTFRMNDDLWTSRSALLWRENRMDEAAEDLKRGETWARELPESGEADAERNAVRLLRAAMEAENRTRSDHAAIELSATKPAD